MKLQCTYSISISFLLRGEPAVETVARDCADQSTTGLVQYDLTACIITDMNTPCFFTYENISNLSVGTRVSRTNMPHYRLIVSQSSLTFPHRHLVCNCSVQNNAVIIHLQTKIWYEKNNLQIPYRLRLLFICEIRRIRKSGLFSPERGEVLGFF